MIYLPTIRTRLAELLCELEGFPEWQLGDADRRALLRWYLAMGWIISWEAEWLLRAGRKELAA